MTCHTSLILSKDYVSTFEPYNCLCCFILFFNEYRNMNDFVNCGLFVALNITSPRAFASLLTLLNIWLRMQKCIYAGAELDTIDEKLYYLYLIKIIFLRIYSWCWILFWLLRICTFSYFKPPIEYSGSTMTYIDVASIINRLEVADEFKYHSHHPLLFYNNHFYR